VIITPPTSSAPAAQLTVTVGSEFEPVASPVLSTMSPVSMPLVPIAYPQASRHLPPCVTSMVRASSYNVPA